MKPQIDLQNKNEIRRVYDAGRPRKMTQKRKIEVLKELKLALQMLENPTVSRLGVIYILRRAYQLLLDQTTLKGYASEAEIKELLQIVHCPVGITPSTRHGKRHKK